MDARVRFVLNVLETSYTDSKLRLDTIASHVGLSPAHLSQLFKRETGTGFHCTLTDLRLAAAKSYLSSTFLSVKQIAAQVGYNSATSFDRQFRRRCGCSPTTWRQRSQQSAATAVKK